MGNWLRDFLIGGGLIPGFNPGGDDYLQQSQDYLGQQQDMYDFYTGRALGMFGSIPQIDLSEYMSGIGRYASGIEKTAGIYGDILGGYREDLGQYADLASEYAGGILDQYLGAAGQIEDISEEALGTSLGAYEDYLSGYQRLARQDMPGMDVYRGQIGQQTSQNIQRMREMGATSQSAMATLLAGEGNQLRDLAVQSGMYRAQRQQALADAYSNYGQLTQGAYGQRMGAIGQAAGLRGAGYQGAAGIQQGLGMGSVVAGAGIAGQEAAMRQNAYTGAADLLGMGAGLAQNQFYYNEFAPWQSQLGFYSGMAQQTMPYQAGMEYYANLFGYQQAQQQNMMQGFQDMYQNYQNQGAQLGGLLI